MVTCLCSWCDMANKVGDGDDVRPTACGRCGHRADLPRSGCDCGRCRPADWKARYLDLGRRFDRLAAENLEEFADAHAVASAADRFLFLWDDGAAPDDLVMGAMRDLGEAAAGWWAALGARNARRFG